MIIDIHTHTFPDHVAERAVQKLRRSSRICAYSDGTAEGLRRNALAAGIGLSVIQPVATSPSQVEHINTGAILRNEEENADMNAGRTGRAGSRLLSFGCIHPEYEHIREELRRIAEAGVPGIKLHPYFHGCDMDDIRYYHILDAAAENGLIVLTHAGYDQGFPGEHSCTVPMLRRIMQEFRGLTMIAAHMGGWKEWEQVPELLADTGIYLDTSFATGEIVPEEGKEDYWAVDHFDPDPGMTTYREREENLAKNKTNGQNGNAVGIGSTRVDSNHSAETRADGENNSETAGSRADGENNSETAGSRADRENNSETAGTRTGEECSALPEADERDVFRETAKQRSVFGTAKLLEPEQFADIVRAFPEGHILFGTDSPWSDPDQSIAFIRSVPLSEETKQEILGGAAERLLKEKGYYV